MRTARLAIGMMSGTSMDGIDVAAITTDGVEVTAFGPSITRPYSDAEKAVLRAALDAGPTLTRRDQRPAPLAAAERLVTETHAEAFEAFLTATGTDRTSVDVVGFHGQTVFHAPERGLTVQIGDGLALARAIGRPVVYDFRSADVAAGGEGAPLVPIFHAALVAKAGLSGSVAVLNVGGVANVTYVGGRRAAAGEGDRSGDLDGSALVAFDTGPGNALIDDFCRARTGVACDIDGRLAAAGRVDEGIVGRLARDPFFARAVPKSLDRNAFSRAAVEGLSTEDGAATLTAFTAAAVARGLALLPERPETLIVAGGGAHNPTLMAMLGQRTNAEIVPASDLGWSTDGLEAQAFAYLAVRHLAGLPQSFPGTTGVSAPVLGGVLAVP